MNGYELAEKMRRARRQHGLSAPTQAIYYELVAICNEEGWPDVFKCTNSELMNALSMTDKTLIVHRNALIQAGLIYFKSGKHKKAPCSYSFVREIDQKSQNPRNISAPTSVQSSALSSAHSSALSSGPYKTKTETSSTTAPAQAELVELGVDVVVGFANEAWADQRWREQLMMSRNIRSDEELKRWFAAFNTSISQDAIADFTVRSYKKMIGGWIDKRQAKNWKPAADAPSLGTSRTDTYLASRAQDLENLNRKMNN